jgi:hypothetical protein
MNKYAEPRTCLVCQIQDDKLCTTNGDCDNCIIAQDFEKEFIIIQDELGMFHSKEELNKIGGKSN